MSEGKNMFQVGAETAAPSVRSLDQHTPTPWRVVNGYIVSTDPAAGIRRIADMTTTNNDIAQTQDNAALIVRAVNNHAALVALITEAMNSRASDMADAQHPGWSDRALAALQNARA